MNRAVLALGLVALTGAAGVLGAACSSSSSKSSPGTDSGTETGVDGGTSAFAPTLPCTDSIAAVYADPGDVTAMELAGHLRAGLDPDHLAEVQRDTSLLETAVDTILALATST